MKRGGADSPKPLSYLSWIWRLNAGLVFLTVLQGSEEGALLGDLLACAACPSRVLPSA